MSHPTMLPLDRMKFPLMLTDQLRATFAETVSSPLPRRLSALMRRLNVDHDECQEGGTRQWAKRNRNNEPY
jgi:hypothetical protein